MSDNFPPPPTAAVVADLEARRRTDASGTIHYVDDTGAPLLDAETGYQPADALAAARWLYKSKPDLWGTETPTPGKAASSGPETASEVMLKVRRGEMSSTEASAAIAKIAGLSTTSGHVPTKAAATKAPYRSLSEAMIAMKRGDAGAEAAVKSFLR